MKKTFLLGLGAQKAGTSWVYQYLRKHPDCEMGVIKEKAVFPAYFTSYDTKRRTVLKIEALRRELDSYQQRLEQGEAVRSQFMLGLMENLAAEHDLRYYLTYFERLLEKSPTAKLVGEITPAYSSLKADDLAQVKALLQGAGYNVRVMFLMRDPIERCYSAIRMDQRRSAEDKEPHKSFAEKAVMEWCRIRTSYELIIPEIESVFTPEELYISFYETLFSDGKVREMCDFLGISHAPANFRHRVNSSPREAEPDEAQLALVRRFYDTTYTFVADRLGEDQLAQIWPHYRQSF